MATGKKTGGRKAGTPNKVMPEIRRRAQAFVEDSAAVTQMLLAYRAGTLHPRLVVMFHEYAYGKPKETVEHQGVVTLAHLLGATRPE